MSILINKNTRVVTQGITGKTGQFHTRTCRDYANGKSCFVAGVNPKKPGENFEGIPIFATVKEAKEKTGVNTSVIYVPPPFAAAAICCTAARYRVSSPWSRADVRAERYWTSTSTPTRADSASVTSAKINVSRPPPDHAREQRATRRPRSPPRRTHAHPG